MTTTASTTQGEVLPPPTERYTVLGWLKKNLFGSWLDAILTILAALFIAWAVYTGANWVFKTARWDVIVNNFALFMKGQYPTEEAWRLWLVIYLAAAIGGLMWGVFVRSREMAGWLLLILPLLFALAALALGSNVWINVLLIDVVALVAYFLGRTFPKQLQRPTITLLLLYLPLILLIVRGFGENGFMPQVGTNFWGGLLLSLLLAIIGIVFSFPIGVLLALGRQSELKAIHWLSVIYIEVIRGVPLVTLLFMGMVMLPYVLPAGLRIDNFIRVAVAIVMFAAAYLAENVRGGLQSIPKGQYEAADAIALGGFAKMTRIILPQALRAVIPVLVGQFIGLFKDTSLVALVGLFDLLGIARAVLANPNYIGTQLEVYTFIALVYWVFSYGLSYASKRLETSLGVGER
ncbi:MAG TPA: amino acid ABC transporter permease [Caldilineae bacterium]|nr:amino acid ABC transporter permease [Caldilineae bacterium]